ncbi:type I-C CRISPR-associated protein Cas5c [bacterium]|nr:type I-C CRISPR-associated protein Cas5c [bacterium]
MDYLTPKNSIEFQVWGRYALFTDPLTKLGGEKFSYHIPTCESLKGICKSIYWKPTFIWVVDKVRVIKPIRTQSKGVKPIKLGGGNDLSIYTFLSDVEYQVQAHFEWNMHRPELASDRIDGKHFEIARRSLERGGRQDIFLGTRDCQGYVEPCGFGEGASAYADITELGFDLMFHSFLYPDEVGENKFYSCHWRPVMRRGEIGFPPPEDCPVRKYIRDMTPKSFEEDRNFHSVQSEYKEVIA